MAAAATLATWPSGRQYRETCARLMDVGVIISRPPRDGRMALVRTPDDIWSSYRRAAARGCRAMGVHAEYG
jgi:hypothetical protein